MERVFLENGNLIAVTKCTALPLTVTQIKTAEKDGYQAVQVAYGKRLRNSAATAGKLKKLKLDLTPKGFIEFNPTAEIPAVGSEVRVEAVLKEGDQVNLTGTSKGRGYAGVIKRHGFHRQPVSGGQSDRTRAPGAIGAQTPGKVVMGKKMPGHMGNATTTVMNAKVIKINADSNELLISGNVPGPRNSWVVIKKL